MVQLFRILKKRKIAENLVSMVLNVRFIGESVNNLFVRHIFVLVVERAGGVKVEIPLMPQ